MEEARPSCKPLQRSNATVAAAHMHTSLTQQHTKYYELHNATFAYICTVHTTSQRCKLNKNTISLSRQRQLHAKHCKPLQCHTYDSAHATSHTIQLHTSIALAAMPWRSGNSRQQTTRPTPRHKHTSTSKCHLATPTAPPHTPLRARHHNTPHTTAHPTAETSQTGHPTAPQGQLAAATNIATKIRNGVPQELAALQDPLPPGHATRPTQRQ